MMNMKNTNMPGLDVDCCRRQFPAFTRQVNGHDAIFFDGAAGSQVPQCVADAMTHYLLHTNANHDGLFATSMESDELVHRGHEAMADMLGTDDPDTIAFGPNMTTLTFGLSRALARTWQPGDELVVTRLDHDANVTPWVLAARDAGATVKHVGVQPDDCTLDMDDLASKITSKTKLVAVGCASNASGSINPVSQIAQIAHEAGALVFLDAVHYVPHMLPDVVAWNCDFLACSPYKFFGPHEGVLWGRRSLMEKLPAYKLRPASDELPGRWMTGTQSHEAIAGTLAAVDYLASLANTDKETSLSRRERLQAAYQAIYEYESPLAARLVTGLAELPGVRVWGITDPRQFDQRVPTVSITHERYQPDELARRLADQGIFVWHGNFYALPLTDTLGLEPEGMVRIGLLHYNTAEEIDRLFEVMSEL